MNKDRWIGTMLSELPFQNMPDLFEESGLDFPLSIPNMAALTMVTR